MYAARYGDAGPEPQPAEAPPSHDVPALERLLGLALQALATNAAAQGSVAANVGHSASGSSAGHQRRRCDRAHCRLIATAGSIRHPHGQPAHNEVSGSSFQQKVFRPTPLKKGNAAKTFTH